MKYLVTLEAIATVTIEVETTDPAHVADVITDDMIPPWEEWEHDAVQVRDDLEPVPVSAEPETA